MESNIFEERYEKLNAEQKVAVNTIEGPVMVIAGPGTGKTEILAARICNILLKTDTQAGNILCLTYTEAGVSAMRKRLITFMGDEAYKVNIHTFHSLCKRIIDDYPSFFEDKVFNVMDELTRKKLIEEIQLGLPMNNPWHASVIQTEKENNSSFGNPINDLERLFFTLTENNINSDAIKKQMGKLSDEENYKIAFPDDVYKNTREGKYQKGDIKPAAYEDTLKKWEKLLAASEIYKTYEKKKQELNFADFSDLLVWASEGMKANDELLMMVQERYQYVLVDEFQDTNPLQSEILYQVLSFFEDNPNCFVVGDDDQSIYSFQGADVGNMQAYYEKFKSNIQLVSLVNNYRSSETILQASSKYIKHNTDRLATTIPGVNKNLVASGSFAKQNQSPVFFEYDSSEKQFTAVCEKIKELIAKGVEPEEIAVLASKNYALFELANILSASDMTYELVKPVDILKEQIITEILLWLNYFNRESRKPNTAGIELFKLLHTTDMNTIEIQKLFYKWEENKTTNIVEGLLVDGDETLDMFKPNFAPLAKTITVLQKEWGSMSAPEFVQKIYTDLGFVKRAIISKNSKHTLQVLYSFLKFIEESSKNHPFENLEFHLSQINEHITYQIPVPIYPVLNSKESIKLLTMHGSKGLEFEHVFVVNVDAKGFKKNNKGDFGLTNLFNNHLSTHNQLNDPNSLIEKVKASNELRRLWYVALTRAKKGLYLYSSDLDKPFEGKSELTEDMEINTSNSNDEALLENIKKLLVSNPGNKITSDKNWIQNKIENYVFSPSSLSSILKCENEFYYSRLLSIPSAGNVYMAHGNAIHNALEKLSLQWLNHEEKMDKETFIQHFKDYWFTQRGLVSEKQYKLKLKEGEVILAKYYDKRVPEFFEYINSFSELKVDGQIAGIPFKGIVDKVYFTEIDGNRNNYTITDYKTGNINSAKKKFKVPSDRARANESFNIGDYEYWVQTCIYAHILSGQNQTWKLQQIELDLINPSNEEMEVLAHPVNKQDFEFIETLATSANDRLHAPDFPNGCNKDKCEWCDFTKTYMPPVEEED